MALVEKELDVEEGKPANGAKGKGKKRPAEEQSNTSRASTPAGGSKKARR